MNHARPVQVANRRVIGGWWWRLPLLLGIWLLWAAPMGGGIAAAVWLRGLDRALPAPPNLAVWVAGVPQSSRIVARDGTELAELPFGRGDADDGYREFVPYSDLPPLMVQALLAAEDQRFWRHRGVDYVAMARAAWSNYREDRVVSGASTITQQVARNLLPEIGTERSVVRKLREALLARRMERAWDKPTILTVYANLVFLGAQSYGLAAAARTYFDRPLAALDVADMALLAGLIQAPSRLDPSNDPVAARQRRDEVLRRMVALDMLCCLPTGPRAAPDQVLAAWQARPLGLRLRARPKGELAPWATALARKWLLATMPAELARGGLEVVVSVMPQREAAAQQLVRTYATGLSPIPSAPGTVSPGVASPAVQAASLAVDLRTGYVAAQIGGTDFAASEFDRTAMACRQPGSAWKTVTYAAAIERGAITPATALRDAPVTAYDEQQAVMWKPASGKLYRGMALARDAFAWSLNAPAIEVASLVGTETIIEYAKRWGITTAISERLPMALGASCVRMDELLGVYALIARGGVALPAHLVIAVRRLGAHAGRNAQPTWLLDVRAAADPWLGATSRLDALARAGTNTAITGGDASPATARRMTAQTAFLMRTLLLAVVGGGTAARVPHGGLAFAGKTGTTNDNTDAWFVGFTAREASAVWLGYDDAANTLRVDQDGGRAAVPLWIQLARLGPPSTSDADVLGPPPPDVARYRIDPDSGLLAGEGVVGREVWLRNGTEPTEASDGVSTLGVDAARTTTEF